MPDFIPLLAIINFGQPGSHSGGSTSLANLAACNHSHAAVPTWCFMQSFDEANEAFKATFKPMARLLLQFVEGAALLARAGPSHNVIAQTAAATTRGENALRDNMVVEAASRLGELAAQAETIDKKKRIYYITKEKAVDNSKTRYDFVLWESFV